ncbi:MarR family transcriptional regulator [Streptomyces sp. WMMC500]|uniref:MarR family transcriptional regulator n=1 Tax=Streptomyces sp. WMMC500 TaxID=3015154 RepID=UPI00248CB9A9|nr:MarR family transcriptional regulator [Streptomyces sp. WMMC500]WBB57947.1 MarR family transcriptional regulator [Streptomyces sp. WMMC500]
MQRTPPALLPLLRSPFQGELLAWLYLHPQAETSLADLAARFGVSSATASREADRLAAAELITDRRRGNLRLIRANTEGRLAGALTDLLALTYGPIAVLGEIIFGVPGVEDAYIYGSWAARYRGERGGVPEDVDVLAIGAPDEDDLYEAARTAERILGREVNVHRVSAARWHSPEADPFLTSVRERPRVQLEAPDRSGST